MHKCLTSWEGNLPITIAPLEISNYAVSVTQVIGNPMLYKMIG